MRTNRVVYANSTKLKSQSRKRKHSRDTKVGENQIATLAIFVIPKFLEMVNTIKQYHWKASS